MEPLVWWFTYYRVFFPIGLLVYQRLLFWGSSWSAATRYNIWYCSHEPSPQVCKAFGPSPPPKAFGPPFPQGLRPPPSPPKEDKNTEILPKKISRSAGSIERALGKDARSRWPCSRRLSSRFLDVERRPFSGARCREGAPHFLPFASTSLQLLFPAISKLCPFFCHGVSGWHERVEPQKTTSDVFLVDR